MVAGHHTKPQPDKIASKGVRRPATAEDQDKEALRLAAIDDAFGALADAKFSSYDLEQEHKEEIEQEIRRRGS